MLWTGFQRPKRLEFDLESLTDRYGKFSAQPFERGFAVTVGHAMRRVLLSSIEGAAITGIKIEGVLHEFSSLPDVVEDTTDLILNLKNIPFRLHTDTPKTLVLNVKRPGEVTAGDIEQDPDVECLAPEFETSFRIQCQAYFTSHVIDFLHDDSECSAFCHGKRSETVFCWCFPDLPNAFAWPVANDQFFRRRAVAVRAAILRPVD